MDESTERRRTVANRSANGTERLRLPIAEAAERLGLSTDAVRGRIHRGTLRGEKIEGIWHVEMPPEPTADIGGGPSPNRAANGDRTVGDRSATGANGEPNAEPTGAMAALIEAKNAEIAYLRAALDAALAAERDERRRADTIILELSRRPAVLPDVVDAPVDQNQAAGQSKSVTMGEDATRPETSLLGRLLRWLRGS